MTKATATQNSGSANINLSLQGPIDGACHGLAVGHHAGEPLHDRGRCVRGDAAHVAHRPLAVAAMVFSASASFTESLPSSALRSASATALSFSRVSVEI